MRMWKPRREMPPLEPEERCVLLESATEKPGCGRYEGFSEKGLYLCRQCGNPLYRWDAKFDCGCGWPAFDRNLPEAVREKADPDGMRKEIVCANCGGHLGHVFRGEGFTSTNTRHCVNSLALWHVATREARFAAGCFWGVEHAFSSLKGVVLALSGYSGGKTPDPTYRQVCGGNTGHAESVRVDFLPDEISYEKLLGVFFEIHDPTQRNRQGPDVGPQYRSAIFYLDEGQHRLAEAAIEKLRVEGVPVVTELLPADAFYDAEDDHQRYFEKQGKM